MSRRRKRRILPGGIAITRIGTAYILVSLLVAVTATNTGNNALFMVVALMLGVLAVSGLSSHRNLRGLAVELKAPVEVYAKRPCSASFTVRNRSWLLPHWFLLVSLLDRERPQLIPYLPRRGQSRGRVELLFPRRGRHLLRRIYLTSFFPFAFFRKQMSYPAMVEVLVYPELFGAGVRPLEEAAELGDDASRRAGWGHDLHQLRQFRDGDDPRHIHWKQTAKTGRVIFMEREAERGNRVSLLFDNATGELTGDEAEARFERLVSEAATAAVDFLDQGLDVELVTRDRRLPFAGGRRQRYAILEALALLEPGPRDREPLRAGDRRVPQLRFSVEGEAESAA